MPGIFEKLNLNDQIVILAVNPPVSLKSELRADHGARVQDELIWAQ